MAGGNAIPFTCADAIGVGVDDDDTAEEDANELLSSKPANARSDPPVHMSLSSLYCSRGEQRDDVSSSGLRSFSLQLAKNALCSSIKTAVFSCWMYGAYGARKGTMCE